MQTKRVQYTDEDGRKWVTTIPQDSPDSEGPMGVPYGPPDLSGLGFPEALGIRVHNALVDREILTWNDFRRRRDVVVGALKAALRDEIGALERAYVDSQLD